MALLCAAAVGLLAGCGGGGEDSGAAAGTSPTPAALAPVAVPSGDGGAAAVAALGSLEPVDDVALDRQLDGFESLGAPHDPFRQQGREAEAEAVLADPSATAAEASADAAAVPAAPTVPLGGTAVTAPAPTAPAPTAPAVTAPAAGVPGSTAPATTTGADGSTAGATAAGGRAVTPAKRAEAAGVLVADLDVSGETASGAQGAQVPPETRWLTIASVTPRGVVLRLGGVLLAGGEDAVTLDVGESVTLRAADGATRRVTLVRVRAA